MVGISCDLTCEQLLQNLAFPRIRWPHRRQKLSPSLPLASGRVNEATPVDLDGIITAVPQVVHTPVCDLRSCSRVFPHLGQYDMAHGEDLLGMRS